MKINEYSFITVEVLTRFYVKTGGLISIIEDHFSINQCTQCKYLSSAFVSYTHSITNIMNLSFYCITRYQDVYVNNSCKWNKVTGNSRAALV